MRFHLLNTSTQRFGSTRVRTLRTLRQKSQLGLFTRPPLQAPTWGDSARPLAQAPTTGGGALPCPKLASLVGMFASFLFSFPPFHVALLCVTSFVQPHNPHLPPSLFLLWGHAS